MRIAVALMLAVAALGAQAQSYPSRPVKIIVPFGAGGPADIFARFLGKEMEGPLGQPVVVENRPGAGGNIGADAVAKAPADGYTLLMATTGVMAINNAMYKNLSYDAEKDLVPLAPIGAVTTSKARRSAPSANLASYFSRRRATPIDSSLRA